MSTFIASENTRVLLSPAKKLVCVTAASSTAGLIRCRGSEPSSTPFRAEPGFDIRLAWMEAVPSALILMRGEVTSFVGLVIPKENTYSVPDSSV